MPGAYAHITLVNLLSEDLNNNQGEFPTEAITCVLDYLGHCELGAVSPDYPYLVVGSDNAKKWADNMHYNNTTGMIRHGVNAVKSLKGETKRKAFAWLLGYAAHVATDTTIHPVVELKVGPYHSNRQAHRVCEMNQDAYIFQRLNLGDIGLCEHLDSGIGRCEISTIKKVWEAMLKNNYPDQYHTNPPKINDWHNGFRNVVDLIGEEGNKLFPLARHVAVGLGLTYPLQNEIEMQYIKALPTPVGAMDYDAIFDKAKRNVRAMWEKVAKAVFTQEAAGLDKLTNWDLDRGRDEEGRLVYWS